MEAASLKEDVVAAAVSAKHKKVAYKRPEEAAEEVNKARDNLAVMVVVVLVSLRAVVVAVAAVDVEEARAVEEVRQHFEKCLHMKLQILKRYLRTTILFINN